MYFSNKETFLRLLYNIGIYLAQGILPFIALFNSKIKQGVKGRAKTFSVLEKKLQKNYKTIWYHCASLGEYEQGLPVFKALRNAYPNHTILLTFFSPSGYEIKKNTNIADLVLYLPLDTPANASRFLKLVNPDLIIFVKYDIWPNYLREVKKRKLQALLISALLRKNQTYFKWYGSFMRAALFAFEHIFVQDETSKKLLNSINYNCVSISGDTRFDRVFSQLQQDNELNFISTFKDNKTCFVAGSTWPEDEQILVDLINTSNNLKFVVAPHNIKANQIQRFQKKLIKSTILFSNKTGKNLKEFDVMIIDTIGLLSKIYYYANIAYVGGAMGLTGLHNTLEPAVFGVPIIIGKHYNKFPEAKHMIKTGGMYSVKSSNELKSVVNQLTSNPNLIQHSGIKNYEYIKKNTGAVIQITNHLRI